ncbi:hypothetical protein Tco_1404149 [Tanacetum coccineum]
MEIPDTMISYEIKKQVGYNFYIAKKKESSKDKIVDEPEEQRMSLVKSRRGKGFMCYGDQAVNVLNKDVVPRKTTSLTIAEETVSKILQKGSKASRLESSKQKKQAVVGEGSSNAHNKHYADLDSDSDAIPYSLCSDITEESDNEPDDANDSDMDLSNDNLDRDDDVARFGVFMYNKSTETPYSTYFSPTVTSSSLDFSQNLLNETPANELMDFVSNPVYTDAQTTSMVIYLEEMFADENAHHIPSLPAKKIPYTATTPQPSSLQAIAKKLMQKAKKNMRKINFKKEVTQKFKE